MAVPQTPGEAAPTRPAATVILLREGDAPDRPEVLLLRRHDRAGFAASAWVFPGGVVDPGDAAIDGDSWTGIDPDDLAARFELTPEQVLATHVAAARETYEEAGILLAAHGDGRAPDLAAPAFTALRRDLNDRSVAVDLAAFLRAHDLVLDLGAVTYFSRWITPIQEPRRYDTSFFVAMVPDGAAASPDDVETTQARWITAQQALDDPDVGIIFPTEKTLRRIVELGTPADVIAHARAQTHVAPVQPHILFDDDGRLHAIVLPDDERYPHEVYR